MKIKQPIKNNESLVKFSLLPWKTNWKFQEANFAPLIFLQIHCHLLIFFWTPFYRLTSIEIINIYNLSLFLINISDSLLRFQLKFQLSKYWFLFLFFFYDDYLLILFDLTLFFFFLFFSFLFKFSITFFNFAALLL